MKVKSRYVDDARVVIDPAHVPEQFRHLIPFAKEWSIGDDVELETYIATCIENRFKELATAFRPHFEDLWMWHNACEAMVPQADELVMFDIAASAAACVNVLFCEPDAEPLA